MQIPPEKIQEILERVDLVALISRYVELKKAGRSFRGLCPFHGEKTPSFHVFPESRHFKCFGCDEGGDAISFLKRHGGLSFVDAVRELAKEAGVTLEERDDPAARERAQLLEASELARRHFEERLWTSPLAKLGREHLEQRGVGESLARQFCLGYALNSWNDLADRLVKEGILEWGARAGLCAPRKSGDGYYDVFRGRLMIPIRSPEGRTVAFGARLVEETRPGAEPGPKYLNSRESPLYRKGETLYALDLARDEVRRTRSAILVEGYFDVIGLFCAGVRNAVALCSTALTPGHLAALARADAKELILLFDGDAAGLKAVERLAAPILAAGVSARVASLPEGDDPDTYAMREGKSGVDALLKAAPPLSEHLLERALPRGRASGFEEKMAALARFRPLLEGMPLGMARALLIAQLAEHLGVSEGEVKAHLVAEARPPPRPAAFKAATQAPRRALPAPDAMFAALLLQEPPLKAEPDGRFLELLPIELRMLIEVDAGPSELGQLEEGLRKPVEQCLAEIGRMLTTPDLRRRALQDTSVALRLGRVEKRHKEVTLELEAASRAGDEEELKRLQRESIELNAERKRLKGRAARNPVAGAAAPSGGAP
jgi:DNA primase